MGWQPSPKPPSNPLRVEETPEQASSSRKRGARSFAKKTAKRRAGSRRGGARAVAAEEGIEDEEDEIGE
jgi:hypothetical protein